MQVAFGWHLEMEQGPYFNYDYKNRDLITYDQSWNRWLLIPASTNAIIMTKSKTNMTTNIMI